MIKLRIKHDISEKHVTRIHYIKIIVKMNNICFMIILFFYFVAKASQRTTIFIFSLFLPLIITFLRSVASQTSHKTSNLFWINWLKMMKTYQNCKTNLHHFWTWRVTHFFTEIPFNIFIIYMYLLKEIVTFARKK